MSTLKSILKYLLALGPYRIIRAPINRFDAMDEALASLKRFGFEPRIVIDGGAHLGAWAAIASSLFPGARLHLVEPQPACRLALERLAAERRFLFHPCALSDRSGTAQLYSEEPENPSTGAHLVLNQDGSPATVDVPIRTLEELFAAEIRRDDRPLLKLDLQGHELRALQGGSALLPAIEVVITEISFFQQGSEPTVPQLISFFDERGFDLFDVAALSGRTRDQRLRQADLVFVRRGSDLLTDRTWI
jgi:FkbM family methyltransferase